MSLDGIASKRFVVLGRVGMDLTAEPIGVATPEATGMMVSMGGSSANIAAGLVKLGCEAAPLLLGFILGPMMEENLRRALLISRGDWGTFVTRPLSASLLVAAALMIFIVMLPSIRKKRESVFVEEE